MSENYNGWLLTIVAPNIFIIENNKEYNLLYPAWFEIGNKVTNEKIAIPLTQKLIEDVCEAIKTSKVTTKQCNGDEFFATVVYLSTEHIINHLYKENQRIIDNLQKNIAALQENEMAAYTQGFSSEIEMLLSEFVKNINEDPENINNTLCEFKNEMAKYKYFNISDFFNKLFE